jgi:hypothetical protein
LRLQRTTFRIACKIVSVDLHECACSSFGRLLVTHGDVTYGGTDRLVTELLFHECKVHVGGNQVTGNGMLRTWGCCFSTAKPASLAIVLDRRKNWVRSSRPQSSLVALLTFLCFFCFRTLRTHRDAADHRRFVMHAHLTLQAPPLDAARPFGSLLTCSARPIQDSKEGRSHSLLGR